MGYPFILYRLLDGTLARYDVGRRRLIDPPFTALPPGAVPFEDEADGNDNAPRSATGGGQTEGQ